MRAQSTRWVVGPFLLLVLVAAPGAVAVLDLPLDDANRQPSGDGGIPVNPEKAKEEIQERLDRSTREGGGVVPAPPGHGRDLSELPTEVGSVLAENWAITTAVTAGLVVTGFVGWVLASRYIDPKVALKSPERSMLYGFVKGNPGVHLKQLSTEFQMKTSTVLWHVRKLESADLIRSKKANGYRVFYPVSGGLEASKVSEAVTALGNANARSIFHFFAERPDAALRELTEQLGINPGTVRWHVKKLKKAGLLDDDPNRSGALRVTELGVKAWNQHQGMPQTVQVPVVAAPGQEPAQTEEVTA